MFFLSEDLQHHFSVSILVFVELALDDSSSYWDLMQYSVSILVFVELALDASENITDGAGGAGFNPCFRGTCSWWLPPWSWLSYVKSVSILVFVELALDGWLVWQRAPRDRVSILVFVELALDDDFAGSIICPPFPSFNPCFRGTCSWWKPTEPLVWGVSGFNPCFRGTCSWCFLILLDKIYLRYVSILVFVELALDVKEREGMPLTEEVSILVFVELALDV